MSIKNSSKNIIAIDASSSAIGYAVFVEGELITSGSVHIDNPYSWQPQDRVPVIETKFANELSSTVKQDVMARTGKKISEVVDTLVFNLGYVQSNGVDEGVIALADVQSYIRHILYYKLGLSYAPILDISWIDALKKFVDYKGGHNDLKNRAVKKERTVYAATKIKYGEFKDVSLVKAPFYQIDATTETMSDDEADAIFSGYAYMFLDIPNTTILNKKEKARLAKVDKAKKEVAALKKRYETAYGHIQKSKAEIGMYEEKEKVSPSKVNQNAILTRKEKIKMLEAECNEIKASAEKIREKIQKGI